MTDNTPREESSTGKAALYLGIASSTLVFGIGFCAITAAQSGLIEVVGGPAYVCGAASGFIGIIATVLGGIAMFNKQANRTSATAGLVLGLLSICMFFGFLSAFG